MGTNKGEIKSFELEGWVERVIGDEYSQKVLVRTNPDEFGIQYPQRSLFKMTKKLKEKGIDFNIGDKVKVSFFPWVSEGVSKAGKEYCIGELMTNKIEVLEKAKSDAGDETPAGQDDLPF